ncbi:MAG: 50S ribosomal protein L24 [Clostridia bacterium]
MKSQNIKVNDNVLVLTGKSKGKKGKVLTSIPKAGRIIVQNVNIVTKHKKPMRQGEPGGRIEQEAAIDISNVMLICTKCNKPTRVGHVIEDGKKYRVCKQCLKRID